MKRISCWLALAAGAAALHGQGNEPPVVLHKGLGAWHHAISTKNEEAQKFFDQGLTLTFSFNRHEALRSFEKAAQLDPAAVMPYWGMALAQGPYINMDGDPSFDNKGACAAVNTGLKIKSAPAREMDYLRALRSLCPEYRPDVYITAMRELAGKYPDDPDLQTIYAESLMIPVRWHWYDAQGKPAAGVAEAERVLESVLRRWPQHPGANHYYIHAVESSREPERAVASAQRLMGIVPWAGHMVHMPAHIWMVLGDWETAASVNERAVAVDREFLSEGSGMMYMPYYVHNLHFIVYARSMQGRRAASLKAADELRESVQPMAAMMPEMADAFVAFRMLIYARFGEWQSILKEPEPAENMKSSRLTWSFARVLALKAKDDAAGASREKQGFEEMRQKVSADAMWGQNKANVVLEMASEVLSARLASRVEEAAGHWQRAVDMQDALVYDEPPAWYQPLREAQGAFLISAHRPEQAETVLREGVKRSPRNGRMLFALYESLKAQKKDEDAEWVKREWAAAWAGSDVELRLEQF